MKLKELYNQVKDEQNTPQINIEEVKTQFNEQLSQFKNHASTLYNMGSYRELAEYFKKLAENAEHYIMSESDKNWFDDITQKRNLKELKSYANDFAKVSGEAQALQERMAALYEDMGVILNRYFDIPEEGGQPQKPMQEARSIGKRNIEKLKQFVNNEWKLSNGRVTEEDIMDNIPQEWFDIWESAEAEIRRLISDFISKLEHGKPLWEKELSSAEKNEKERLVKGMKPVSKWEKRYPGRGEEVMYATATKKAKELAEENDPHIYFSGDAGKNFKALDSDQQQSSTQPVVQTASGPRPISQIAREISKDWKNVNYAAKPYLQAMFSLDDITDSYGYDSARSIIAYFLSNASQWKGDVAKKIKNELKLMLKK